MVFFSCFKCIHCNNVLDVDIAPSDTDVDLDLAADRRRMSLPTVILTADDLQMNHEIKLPIGQKNEKKYYDALVKEIKATSKTIMEAANADSRSNERQMHGCRISIDKYELYKFVGE